MQSNQMTRSGEQTPAQSAGLRLHESETLLATYSTMQPLHAMIWFLLLFGSSGTGLGIALAIAWLSWRDEKLGLYDRVLRLVLEINTMIFGRHVVHLTSQRLMLESPGQPVSSIALGNITGTQTRTFNLHGNLLVHTGGPTKTRIGLWAVRCNDVAAQIRAACQRRR